MPTALHMAADNAALEAAVKRSRKLLNKRALVAAVASAVPVPGLDWAVDAALLSKLIPEINKEFGLSAVLIGKFISRDLILKATGKIGVRLTTKQLAKYVPFAGQLVAATVGFAAIRFVGEEHMKDCIRVAREAQLILPLAR